MTCDELRERIVDPSSASHGGHAPVVTHLEECAGCRAAARDYGALDKLVRLPVPPAPPPDFEQDLRRRLLAGPRRPVRSAWLFAGSVFVLALAALFAPRLLRPRAVQVVPAPAPADTPAAPPLAADAPPPDIVAVRSEPITLESPPLRAEEKAEAVALHDFAFLNSFRTLARLAAFFPEPVGAGAPAALPEGGYPSGPPRSPDALTGRFLDWQRTTRGDRARLRGLEQAFRNLPEEERARLEERWTAVRNFSDEERGGLRRLASRMDELDARARERLEASVRQLSQLPREQRAARWRALPFAKPLTGQELEAAQALLLSR